MAANNRVAFVIAATQHGVMLVNRLDMCFAPDGGGGIGVGLSLLEQGAHDQDEVMLGVQLLQARRDNFGTGVVALDIGANIGTHTVTWATAMRGWGEVIAVEPQERVYYALAGNITINNCFNARAIHALAGATIGRFAIPVLDHQQLASFGSCELVPRTDGKPPEEIGQPVCYDGPKVSVDVVTVDLLAGGRRVDLLKVDTEGAEIEVLLGARRTIEHFHPVIIVEYLKAEVRKLADLLVEEGYTLFIHHLSFVAVHHTDPVLPGLLKQGKPVDVGRL